MSESASKPIDVRTQAARLSFGINAFIAPDQENMVPNWVTNKITFAPEVADEIFSTVCPEGEFDFELLVPSPPNMYRGNLSNTDEQDFYINWLAWSLRNWGTKWNCSRASCGVADGKAFIKFTTAWAPPYGVMAAFCNRFGVPFEHRYFDEAPNFWGIERWGTDQRSKSVSRLEKHLSRDQDRLPLAMELCGRDLEAEAQEYAEEKERSAHTRSSP